MGSKSSRLVSVPDHESINDQPLAIPNASFNGLSELGLETMYRLNMGGPLLTAQNDSLGRTWRTDGEYLQVNSSAMKVFVDPTTIRYPNAITIDIGPKWMYATAEAMGDTTVTDLNLNITWIFAVNPILFLYLIRFHFYYIVTKALNTLVFNIYVNSEIAIASLDLSSLKNDLLVHYCKDFVSNSLNGSNTASVSVGPDTVADFSNAILNGLEIMKIRNDVKSLDGLYAVKDLLTKSSSRKNKLGIILGLTELSYCCFMAHKSKTGFGKESNGGAFHLLHPSFEKGGRRGERGGGKKGSGKKSWRGG